MEVSKQALKRSALKLLTAPGPSSLFYPLMRGKAAIFCLHRIHDPARSVPGHDPAFLRQALAYLRDNGFELLGLEQLIDRLGGAGGPVTRAVVFTLDDGYREQVSVAGEIFAEFDCPATVFLTTGFVDGQIWFWWDKIEYAFARTKKRSVCVLLAGAQHSLAWSTERERLAARHAFTEKCKKISDREKADAIGRLACELGVDLPDSPPAEYQPVSWEEARQFEQRGISFGPHTMTHPILSQVEDEVSRREIGGSWKRLREELVRPVPVFCYPNGRPGDFGPREFQTLREMNFKGALAVEPGFAERFSLRGDDAERFKIRRSHLPTEQSELVEMVSGIYRLRELLRGNRPARPPSGYGLL